MIDDSITLTGGSIGAVPPRPQIARPHLVVIGTSDDPRVPSSRHVLADIDEVHFGRGPREIRRRTINGLQILELRIPDPRMSTQHGKLVRSAGTTWLLTDPSSKNGAVVDGRITRQAVIGDGSVIELGHTFLLFCLQPLEQDAPDDAVEGQLGVASPAFATFVGPLADGFAALTRLAATPVSVVLLGETGTGKEVVARALHGLSARPGGFIAVNCGALPPALVEAELFGHRRGAFTGAVGERPGLVRSADAGTLFLDEIGELPAASQAAFLRVLQEREVLPVGDDRAVKVDVRLCVATHRDLAELIARGAFREDLYGRLSGFTLELPPLRARRADFGLLLHALLAQLPGGRDVVLSPAALRTLLAHPWPLNIRALEKTLLTAVTLATQGRIDLIHLVDLPRRPPGEREPEPAAPRRAASEGELKERLVGLLTVHRGNVVAVSREIGTRRTQVYRWARRFGLELDGFRRP